ncbi:inositol monophosphatase [Myxococcota bacterium]|nr:inositol monophosphatase [Myxococcota bacterium]MBU1410749.1 inositol monophosphatase [Myxococcota bacterium]MBU1511652.1 inositol monophosphatase [Myxococcota bacterium]
MQNELTIALQIAREAGEILLEGHHLGVAPEAVEHKGAIDLVTPFDRRSEALVRTRLAEHFPGDAVLAEEGGQTEGLGRTGDANRVWCVDPLDGTTNFAHGLPFFCVSIALLVDGEAAVGVVHAPALDWTFSRVAGEAPHFNGSPMPPLAARDDLGSSLLMFGCGYDRTTRPERYLTMLATFMTRTQGLRRTGSAALDCCICARGQVDGYMEVNLHPWDLAAGVLIARGSSAVATDVDGGPFDPFTGRLVLGRPGIHEKMLDVIREHDVFLHEKDGSYAR